MEQERRMQVTDHINLTGLMYFFYLLGVHLF